MTWPDAFVISVSIVAGVVVLIIIVGAVTTAIDRRHIRKAMEPPQRRSGDRS